jgi:predicted transcriptional regulator
MNGIQIIIDNETYKKLSTIGTAKNKSALDEVSEAIRKHIEFETRKISEMREGKSLLCEG